MEECFGMKGTQFIAQNVAIEHRWQLVRMIWWSARIVTICETEKPFIADIVISGGALNRV